MSNANSLIAIVLAAALLSGPPARAQALRWGLPDAALAARFSAELTVILNQPATVGSSKGAATVQIDAQTQRQIAGDPELAEAYRSDPAATLALIRRIRDAGGLPN